MEKFRDKYRTKSTRLPNWDYSSNGAYFITICTKKRTHFLGEISQKKMILNEAGDIAQKFWKEIPNHFDTIELGEYVIMPNHIHGILIIRRNNNPDSVIETPNIFVETPKLGVSTKINHWIPKSIGVIINQYKRICTIHIRKLNPDFEWQSRYYDHVIRNFESFERIQQYIFLNPAKWENGNYH